MAVESIEEDKDKDQPLTLSSQDNNNAGGIGASPAPQQKGSGRFTNLQKYIGANQGGAAQLGNQIGRVAEKEQQKAAPQQQALQNIQQNVQAEKQRLGQAGQFAQTIQSGSNQDLQNLLAQQGGQFQQIRTGQSQLPQLQTQAASAIGGLTDTSQNLQDIAGQAKTESGRFGLLRQAVQGPQYSTGQRRLDQLILQGSGRGALGDLQQGLANRATTAQQYVGDVSKQTGTALGELGSEATAAQEQLQGALGTGMTGIQSAVESRLTPEAQQKKIDEINAMRQQLATGAIDEATLKAIDPTGQLTSGMDIYNTNLSDYLTPQDQLETRFQNLTAANVVNPEELQRLQALQQLAGQEGGFLSGVQAPVQQDLYNYDTTRLQADLESRKNQAQNQFQQLSDYWKSIPGYSQYHPEFNAPFEGVRDLSPKSYEEINKMRDTINARLQTLPPIPVKANESTSERQERENRQKTITDLKAARAQLMQTRGGLEQLGYNQQGAIRKLGVNTPNG